MTRCTQISLRLLHQAGCVFIDNKLIASVEDLPDYITGVVRHIFQAFLNLFAQPVLSRVNRDFLFSGRTGIRYWTSE
jgi:hypothetical protein